jgi:hypothetical protein
LDRLESHIEDPVREDIDACPEKQRDLRTERAPKACPALAERPQFFEMHGCGDFELVEITAHRFPQIRQTLRLLPDRMSRKLPKPLKSLQVFVTAFHTPSA